MACVRRDDGEAACESGRVARRHSSQWQTDASIQSAAALHEQATVPIGGQRNCEADTECLSSDALAAIDRAVHATIRR